MTDPAQQAHANASKLAQLLAQVIVEHAPHTARLAEEAKYEHLEMFLEDLEQHTSKGITPFLTSLMENATIPPEFIGLVTEAIDTPAQFSAIVTQLFLYGVVSQLLSTSVTPFLQGVSNDLWVKAVADGISVPISAPTIATAAARGLNLGDPPTVDMPAWAYPAAAKSGVSADDLNLMASIVGTPPAPQELFELLRRNLINQDRLKQGLREGDTRDDWIDVLAQLAHGWLTPTDFVRAAVQAQMSYSDAQEWATKTGLDTTTALPITADQVGGSNDMFGLAWAIAGRPPGPVELANMALRGIIDWEGTGAGATTFQQGIAESDVKTKWTGALRKLSEYLPPPAAIGSLLERGAITTEQAVTLWKQRGVPDALAQGYAYIANQQHVGQDKLLAKSEITTAYFDRIINRQEALDYLDQLGYRAQVGEEILAIQDFRREIKAINSVVNRVLGEYGSYRLSATDAKTALVNAGLDPDNAQLLLSTYETLRQAPIRLPNTRDIGLAVKSGTITVEEGLAELERLGYQPRDAAITLSAHAGVKITPLPPAGNTVTG